MSTTDAQTIIIEAVRRYVAAASVRPNPADTSRLSPQLECFLTHGPTDKA